MTKLLTNQYKTHLVRQLKESISEMSNTAYYMFASEHVPRSTAIDTPEDTIQETFINAYRTMIFGKRITTSDVYELVRNIPYVANTVYPMYDDQDADLNTKDFFVVVNEGSNYHVYKCLDNAGNGYSTAEPTFAHVTGANTITYATSDGYIWKYMYTVDSTLAGNFSTDDYFPVVANTSVESSAVYSKVCYVK